MPNFFSDCHFSTCQGCGKQTFDGIRCSKCNYSKKDATKKESLKLRKKTLNLIKNAQKMGFLTKSSRKKVKKPGFWALAKSYEKTEDFDEN